MEAFKEQIKYNFKCNGCGSLIVAQSDEFELVDNKKLLLGYECPICKKRRFIRSKELTREVQYVKVKD